MSMAQSGGSVNTRTPLVFTVTRRPPELVPPARRTPYEFKELSDIDNLERLRHLTHAIHFYRNKPSLSERDPGRVIKDAVAKALVWYYPLAGRVREVTRNKLVVECTGEGVVFVEAEADVCLDDFGQPLLLPFPCLEELLLDVPCYSAVLDSPLLLFQVTRLKCGGFILAIQMNHTTMDGQGMVQFLNAVAELARGAQSPSIEPVWERHLLSSRNLPRVTCKHPEFNNTADTEPTFIPKDGIVHKSFFFGSTEIAALRRFIPPHLRSSRISKFEIIVACIWRCRVIALQPKPEELVPLKCIINARTKCDPPLPNGYYGNVLAYAIALTTASKLSSSPIGYALELIIEAKADVARDYRVSIANLIATNGMFHLTTPWSLLVSDLARIGFDNLDFGWGPPAYGGPTKSGVGVRPGVDTYCIPFRNVNGEKGSVVPMCLLRNEMEIFVSELNKLLRGVPEDPIASVRSSTALSSAL